MRWNRVAALVCVLMLLLSGCRAAGAAGRAIGEAEVAGKGAAAAAQAERQAAKRAAILAPHTSDLDAAIWWTVVKSACMANDLLDVGKASDLGDAARRALINFGGDRTLVYRVQNLAADLYAARSSSDQARQAAAFAICESA